MQYGDILQILKDDPLALTLTIRTCALNGKRQAMLVAREHKAGV